ncbi:MAG TPA: hypothetical protein VK421_19485, partial [Pyrinomonadaceae bacterium]|nr:hypothetical protein [Pyrinomonadaceae bacterium]
TVPAAQAAEAIEAARAALRSLAAAPVTAAEFETARRELSASPQSGRNPDYAFAENWLDSLTFGHPAGDNTRAFDTLKPDDLRRIAERLFRNAPVASVVAGDAAALRASLAGLPGGIEEANGSAKTRAAPSQPTPAAGRRPQ